MKSSKEDIAHACKMLRKFAPMGSTIYTVVRHVAQSGMSRRMDCFVIHKGRLQYLSGWIATVLELPLHKSSGFTVRGCGMDMGFHVVNSLSYALHGHGEIFKFRGKEYRSGYTFNHEWI